MPKFTTCMLVQMVDMPPVTSSFTILMFDRFSIVIPQFDSIEDEGREGGEGEDEVEEEVEDEEAEEAEEAEEEYEMFVVKATRIILTQARKIIVTNI